MGRHLKYPEKEIFPKWKCGSCGRLNQLEYSPTTTEGKARFVYEACPECGKGRQEDIKEDYGEWRIL
jgi:transposase-like protein